MPLYDFACAHCQTVVEHLAKPDQLRTCETCGTVMTRLISVPSPHVPPELTPYYDNGLGAYITTRQQRRALMKRYDLVEVGTTHRHGATGTLYSEPGKPARSAKPSGAFAPRTKDGYQA